MDRRNFIKTMARNIAACSMFSFLPTSRAFTKGSSTGAAGRTGRKPNVIVILVDDLGYADLGCQSLGNIPTPNIDSLAESGVRFTNGYISSPMCSPTRAGLLTGRYQQRFGHEFNPGPPKVQSSNFGLPLTEITLADRMKSLGYATGIVGKWHLGDREKYLPTRRGFDEFFGFLEGEHPYKGETSPDNPIMRGEKAVEEKDYLTDAFAREAVSFIGRHAEQPFFLYLPFNAVHTPLQATGKRLFKFRYIEDRQRRTFVAMLDALDEAIGTVLGKLRELELEENTLIMFLSDNGAPTLKTSSSNAPLRGGKGQLFEGGIRIPYIVQWKSALPAGAVYDDPVISLDIVPTALDAAGSSAADPRLDGTSLLPFLRGEKFGPVHESLFWRHGEQYAVRSGNWKLLKLKTGDPMLFDLSCDIGEKNDLAGENPEKLGELQAAFDSWNANNIDPLWTRGNIRDRKIKRDRNARTRDSNI